LTLYNVANMTAIQQNTEKPCFVQVCEQLLYVAKRAGLCERDAGVYESLELRAQNRPDDQDNNLSRIGSIRLKILLLLEEYIQSKVLICTIAPEGSELYFSLFSLPSSKVANQQKLPTWIVGVGGKSMHLLQPLSSVNHSLPIEVCPWLGSGTPLVMRMHVEASRVTHFNEFSQEWPWPMGYDARVEYTLHDEISTERIKDDMIHQLRGKSRTEQIEHNFLLREFSESYSCRVGQHEHEERGCRICFTLMSLSLSSACTIALLLPREMHSRLVIYGPLQPEFRVFVQKTSPTVYINHLTEANMRIINKIRSKGVRFLD